MSVFHALHPAGPAFAACMAAVHASAFPPREQWSAPAMALQLSAPGAFGFVAPAGGLVLARTAADEAEILTLAVAPDARGRGLGRVLLLRAMAEAASRGGASIVLEVAAPNAAAQALYAATGFRCVGRRPRYYPCGTDALILRAPLTAAAHPACG